MLTSNYERCEFNGINKSHWRRLGGENLKTCVSLSTASGCVLTNTLDVSTHDGYTGLLLVKRVVLSRTSYCVDFIFSTLKRWPPNMASANHHMSLPVFRAQAPSLPHPWNEDCCDDKPWACCNASASRALIDLAQSFPWEVASAVLSIDLER